VFIVGCLGDDWSTPAQILALSEGRTGHLEKSKPTRKDIAEAPSRSSESYRESGFGQFVEGEFATLKASGGVLGGGSETLLIP
jgi:hypothetical protein